MKSDLEKVRHRLPRRGTLDATLTSFLLFFCSGPERESISKRSTAPSSSTSTPPDKRRPFSMTRRSRTSR